jgi:hypothetical protein
MRRQPFVDIQLDEARLASIIERETAQGERGEAGEQDVKKKRA